jgi:hypothetical protein
MTVKKPAYTTSVLVGSFINALTKAVMPMTARIWSKLTTILNQLVIVSASQLVININNTTSIRRLLRSSANLTEL